MLRRVKAKQFAKPEPASVAMIDWRAHAATWATQPFTVGGREYEAGTSIVVSGMARAKPGSAEASYLLPNIAAMLLGQAARIEISHHDLKPTSLLKSATEPAQVSKLFDTFECRLASVLLSYSALEAFANEEIASAYAHGFRYEPILKSGASISYDLPTIERNVMLEEKLSQTLPTIFKIKGPKGRHEWNRFQNLKRVRNRIVHCKAIDRSASSADDNTLWKALFDPGLNRISFAVYELMGYFFESDLTKMPRWFAEWPYAEPAP